MRSNLEINSNKLGLGDIVGVYHDKTPMCYDDECQKRTIGGFVTNIVGAKITVRQGNSETVYDTSLHSRVIKIEDLPDERKMQILAFLDEEPMLPKHIIPSPRRSSENSRPPIRR